MSPPLTHENIRFPDEDEDSKGFAPIKDIIEVDKIINNSNATAAVSRQEQLPNGLQNVGTVIEMGVQSQLILAPGGTGQLHFEITNYRNEPIFHTFQVTGEQRYLVSLSMQRYFGLLFKRSQIDAYNFFRLQFTLRTWSHS